jgi:ABC-type multidrug transport system fused ATPase/permease subunit
VLHDVSFVARPGEVVALVGPSGAGKSTLVSLIARFYDPDEGRVLLDGRDLRDLTLAGLRRHVGIVFQDSFLFATTVRENIAVGRPGADEREIVAAAKAANAWAFVETLPKGLDTYVGERGVKLSEGQKQRIAIARAFLRDPRLLILDEPTSALDARSEHLLQRALDRLVRDRTTFIIAHRLATVRRADLILVVEDGRIVEQGTHDDLMRAGGTYRELHDLQFAPTDRSSSDARSLAASTRGDDWDSAERRTADSQARANSVAANGDRPRQEERVSLG